MATTTLDRRRVAERFAREAVRRRGPSLERIVLFGSVARGKDGPDSDIDILVVTAGRDRDVTADLDAASFEATTDSGQLVALVVLSAREYDEKKALQLPLIGDVEREGLVLWTRNEST